MVRFVLLFVGRLGPFSKHLGVVLGAILGLRGLFKGFLRPPRRSPDASFSVCWWCHAHRDLRFAKLANTLGHETDIQSCIVVLCP